VVSLSDFVMLTRYADDISRPCAFEPPVLQNTLGEFLSKSGKSQLRIAETEKYAHVTFFFSGGREQPFDGERRLLIPSPKVSTYDECPEMSAKKVTDELLSAIDSGEYDFIVCNFANGDMVGHTGIFEAAVQAVNTLDSCLGRIEKKLKASGGQMLVTADHGNVEKMFDPTSKQAHTAHTSGPVPLVYIGPQTISFATTGTLSDVAPTILSLMHMDIPVEMTGESLATIRAPQSA
jgi:2,3-bisphosphoglycerate-independent phosphoglycerate mutase